MKSPDQIAMEAAKAAVRESRFANDNRHGVFIMIGGKMLPQYQITEEIAEIHAGEVRRIIEDTIRAAIEEALYQAALPSGMTAERLAEVVRISEAYRQWCVENEEHATLEQDNLCSASLCDAVAEILLMRRVMDGPEAAAYAAGYDEGLRKGFATGALAQRDASADEVLDVYVEGDGWNSELCRRIAKIVRNAPLATPDEKET